MVYSGSMTRKTWHTWTRFTGRRTQKGHSVVEVSYADQLTAKLAEADQLNAELTKAKASLAELAKISEALVGLAKEAGA